MEEVQLQCNDLGLQSFKLLEAQNILQIQEREKIPEKDCWKLLEDSKYQFVNGELIKRKNTRVSKEASE